MTTADLNHDDFVTRHIDFAMGACFSVCRVLTITVMAVLVSHGAAVALYGQGSWRPVAAACQSATGSGTAEENLSRLKAQAGTVAEITSAISACETKATELRQQEQLMWIRALEAKKIWDCADARRQFRTLVQRASFYQLQASLEMKKLGDCGEQVRTEDPDLLLQHAKTAYKGRDFRSAREQAWRLVGLRNSLGEQARSLLNDIEEIEVVNELLRRADGYFRSRRVNDACSVLLAIQETHSAFPNMAEIKNKLSGCPLAVSDVVSAAPSPLNPVATVPVAGSTASPGAAAAPRGTPRAGSRSGAAPPAPAAPKTELDKQLLAARGYIDEGNLELANVVLAAAAKSAPAAKAVIQLQDSFKAAKQARDLLELGINLIYQAKYSEAANQLAAVVTGQTSPALVGQAHFYIGVAMSNEFYLRGNGTDRTKAVQQFQSSVSNYSRPDFDQIAPKIKQLYDEAVGN